MPLRLGSLAAFLSSARVILSRGIQEKSSLSFVIGNEAADLDSITSSITFAYLNSLRRNGNPPYIPLLNIRRVDLLLRPELLALLPYAEITEQHLLTLDDFPPKDELGKSSLLPDQTRWILVDHNVLQGDLGRLYGNRVVGCVDHHQDEKKIVTQDQDEPHLIETSASCQSLVINYLRGTWDSKSSSICTHVNEAKEAIAETIDDTNIGGAWGAQIAKLAMASILIDSNGMTDMNKITEHDIKAMNYLEQKASTLPGPSGVAFDSCEFFNVIQKAKSDLSNMSVSDILKKDFKKWEEGGSRIGVSVVVKPLEYLVNKAENKDTLVDTLRTFSLEQGLSILAIMTAYSSSHGKFQRQLLIYPFDKKFAGFGNSFLGSFKSELGLESVNLGYDTEILRAYQQYQVHKSRKQVGPLLRMAMKL